MTRISVIGALLVAGSLAAPSDSAVAQPTAKSIGSMQVLEECAIPNNPELQWIKLGILSEQDDYYAAKACSEATDLRYGAGNGVRWIVMLTDPALKRTTKSSFKAYIHSIAAVAVAVDFAKYVVGVAYNEEWYSLFKDYSLSSSVRDPRDDQAVNEAYCSQRPSFSQQIQCIRDHVSGRQALLKAASNLPVVFLENFVNNDPALGDYLWHPVPSSTDVLAIDAYVWSGQTFNSPVPAELVPANCWQIASCPQRTFVYPNAAFSAAVATGLPTIVMPQWYQDSGLEPLTVGTVDGYRSWLEQPGVVGMVGFTLSRLKALPEVGSTGTPLCWVKRSLGLVPGCP